MDSVDSPSTLLAVYFAAYDRNVNLIKPVRDNLPFKDIFPEKLLFERVKDRSGLPKLQEP